MSKRLPTTYLMTAMLLHAGLLRQVEAQSPQRRSPASVFSSTVTVQEQATGSQIFGVGVNSDAGSTGSVVLNERNFDVTGSGKENAKVSVEVRFISLSANFWERISQDVVRGPAADSEELSTSFWLTFLHGTQVKRLFDFVQTDPRTTVMQAPKSTLCDGQAWTLGITEDHLFVTGMYVTTKDNQVVAIPRQERLPTGLQLSVQPTVSADRRFVSMKLKASQKELDSAEVQQFPVTTPITPIFEGGAVGQPVPFTQFIQQPNFVTVAMDKQVVVPDGGTVLLTGWAKVRQPRDDEPSALSSLPLVGWLFTKAADVPEEKQLLVLITPRIIGDE